MMDNRGITMVEEAISGYLVGSSKSDFLCKRLTDILSNILMNGEKNEVRVKMVNQKKEEPFFGFRVFPSTEMLDKICNKIVNTDNDKVSIINMIKDWRAIDKWVLEMDSAAFDRTEINFTPKELTAMICHELGHIIYSGEPIEIFYRCYLETSTRLSLTDRATQKAMYSIYMIPLTIACMQRNWVNGKNQIKVEFIADRAAIEYGYGEALASAFNKIIKYHGSINRADSAKYDEIESSIEWCNRNIGDVMYRRDHIKDELYYISIRNKSTYLKAVTIINLQKLGARLRERYNGYAVENTIELLSDPKVLEKYAPVLDLKSTAKLDKQLEMMIATESFNLKKKKEMRDSRRERNIENLKKDLIRLPSDFEIDMIAIEIDKATTHNDKLFVLDMIYTNLARIDNFEKLIEDDPQDVRKWAFKIKSMRKDLEMYKEAAINKPVDGKRYKFTVTSPRSYQG